MATLLRDRDPVLAARLAQIHAARLLAERDAPAEIHTLREAIRNVTHAEQCLRQATEDLRRVLGETEHG